MPITVDELADELSQMNYEHARKLLTRRCDKCLGNPVVGNRECLRCDGRGVVPSPFADVIEAVLERKGFLRS